MSDGRHLPATPFVLAIGVGVAVVLSAPFIAQLRTSVRSAFPDSFIFIVGAIGAVILVAALAAAFMQIRDRRAPRYGAIAAAIAIAAGYSLLTAGDNRESNAVERFHFLEYGLITFLFYRAWRPLGDMSILLLPALAGLIVGTAEEWLQWFIPARVGELRDIFLNLVAIGCGLLFSVAVQPPERFSASLSRPSVPRVCRMAAAAVCAVAVFIHVIHLGYEIHDPEAGTFTSRYSAARLLALQADKKRTWQTAPPPRVLVRVSREDQYLSEGIEHVMERNERWASGDFTAAWHENLILERYFAPVLDTPTYAGLAGHRWPPEQRADAEARIRAQPVPSAVVQPFSAANYVSTAYPYRLYIWNKALFWALIAAVAVALLVGSR